MRVFLPILIFLLILSTTEMSQETTGEFRRCFPKWINASQVRVVCKKENDTNLTRIAQYCDQIPSDQVQKCPKMNKTGVSLEKEQDGLCLTITNDSYDLWHCEASDIGDRVEKENFTVEFNNHLTNTSLSAGATDASPSHETDDNSLSQDLTNTSPSPGPTDASSSLNWLYAGVPLLVGVIGLCVWIYKKVKSSRKSTDHLNSTNKDSEMEERGANEAMEDNGVILENGVMLENEVLGENREMQDNGEMLENRVLGENETLIENGHCHRTRGVSRMLDEDIRDVLEDRKERRI